MNKKMSSTIFIALFLFSVVVIPQLAYCQTETPGTSTTVEATPANGINPLLLGGIVAAVVAVVVVIVVFVFLKKKRVNEKSLRSVSASVFQEWVIKKFNGKPSDPSTGVTGLTQGGQPLLILQTDNVGLGEVEAFVDVLVRGKAQRGTIVAFGFEKDSLEGKIKAMDNEIALEMFRISELLNKRYTKRIEKLASAQVTFTPSHTYVQEAPVPKPTSFEKFEKLPNEPREAGLRPKVFVSNSTTEVTDQVKKMLEFLHYDYAMGDKEETTLPFSEKTFGLMKNCDCAIINIAAAEQERRYSGLYILNSNVVSTINAAYLKYNTQVVLLVERKVELPANITGLKRIEYENDDLSFNAAMDLEKILADFKKIA